MYCLALFIVILLYGTISTNAQNNTCYNNTVQLDVNYYIYTQILCDCGVIDTPDGNVADRWAQADCDEALGFFNLDWLTTPQDLPYIQALSAYWNGPQSNVY